MQIFEQLKQLGKESLVYGFGSIILPFIGIFLIPVYTRVFTPSDYGVLELVTICSSIFGIFTILGLDSASARFFYDTDEILDKQLTLATTLACQLCLSVTLGAFLFCGSSQMSQLVFGKPEYAVYFKLVALDFPFNVTIQFVQGLLRYIRKPWKFSCLSVSRLISNVGLTIFTVVVLRKGIYGVYLSKLIVDIVFAGVAVWIAKFWLRPLFSWRRLRELLLYGIPLVPAGIAHMILGSSDRYFLEHYRSLSDVGLYSLGSRIASLLGLVTSTFRLALGPFVWSIYRQKDAEKVYANILTYYLALTSGLAIGLSIFASEALIIFTTKAYYGASVVVSYLTFSIIGNGAYFIASIGVGRVKKSAHIGWTTSVAAGMNILLNFLLIPRLGMIGAAIATLISQWTSAGVLYCVSQHYYPIPHRLDKAGIILGSSALLIAIGSYIQLSNFWLALLLKIVLCFLYLLILGFTGILRPGMFWRLVSRSKVDKIA